LEVDELWTYAGNKKNKVWLIYACHRQIRTLYISTNNFTAKSAKGYAKGAKPLRNSAQPLR
jgi:IS1 family transposase